MYQGRAGRQGVSCDLIGNADLQCLVSSMLGWKIIRSLGGPGQDRSSHRDRAQYVSYLLSKYMLTIVREFVPNVIEPSFGLGRILYSLLEHSYWAREQDKARAVSDLFMPFRILGTHVQVLSFPPLVAPIKCLIVCISQDPQLRVLIHDICEWRPRSDPMQRKKQGED